MNLLENGLRMRKGRPTVNLANPGNRILMRFFSQVRDTL